MTKFKAIPFVRILLPFIFGILLTVYYEINFNPFYFLSITAIGLSVLFFVKQKSVSKVFRNGFIIVADLFLVLSAMQCCYNYNLKNTSDYYGKFISTEQQVWTGVVEDIAKETEKFYKTKLSFKTLKYGNDFKNTKGEIVVYFKKPFDKSLLEPGNTLLLQSSFIELKEPLNPNEFNYKNFLNDRNIFHSCFVDSANVKFISTASKFSLQLWGLSIKQNIIHSFKNSALSNDAMNLCIALITGYDDEISAETINAFAHSGTLHVLSVSGLHTGILYAVLVFLFGIVDRNKRFKGIQVVLIILALSFFALITGFSPPVLRAVIMLSLMVIGKYYFNASSDNTINIIAVSAFSMLLFNPLLIFDTGFLLSYLAILGIIYFVPYINDLMPTNNFYLKKVWQLASVSVAAQITTLPLILVLFHQFPVWFVFSNLIVIPLCTIVMFLGFILLLKLSLVEVLINFCSKVISWLIHLTDSPKWGYIDGIDFNKQDALLLSLSILLLTFFIKNKSYLMVSGALMLILFWQLSSLLDVLSKKEATHISIYHINKCYAVDVKNKTQVQFSSNAIEKDYNYHVKPNQTAYNYADKLDLNVDYVRSNSVSFFHYKNEKHQSVLQFLKPDYLLVSCNAVVNEEMLENLTNLKLLVADGSNNYKQVKQMKQLCSKFGIGFYNTREQGYLSIK